MPTPFYHLSVANQVVEHPSLNPELKRLLLGNFGAFLLGNTAPDVQVLSGQERSATHFFSVPTPANAPVPWERMLSEYPSLNGTKDLDFTQAIFIAGYLCHLQADWIWVTEIFQPVFGPHQSWATFLKRLDWHNVLRAHLDVEVIAGLPVERILALEPVHPNNWLPFIQDYHLEDWWAYLCDQLQPGNSVRTVEVFASRQGIDAHEFRTMLRSDELMQKNIFNRISRQRIDQYRMGLVAKNVALLENYFEAAGYRTSSFSRHQERRML